MARANTREEIIRKGAELIHAQGFNATGLQHEIRGHHTSFFHRFSLLKKILPAAFLRQPEKYLPSGEAYLY